MKTKAELLNLTPYEFSTFTAGLSTKDYRKLSWADIEKIRAFVCSDGCSSAPDLYVSACIVHDFWYRTHRNFDGTPISRKKADDNFKRLIRQKSPLGWFSIVSKAYWLAVRLMGKKAWET